MMHSKKLMLGICLVLLIILIVGYVIMTKTSILRIVLISNLLNRVNRSLK
ncbi:hypothetical protein V665_00317 [Staphylococcus aureus F29214]|nr:hypothetical protein V665_00317 [Staphylococcus aureus F29214]